MRASHRTPRFQGSSIAVNFAGCGLSTCKPRQATEEEPDRYSHRQQSEAPYPVAAIPGMKLNHANHELQAVVRTLNSIAPSVRFPPWLKIR